MKEYIAFGVGMMLALACIMLLENIEVVLCQDLVQIKMRGSAS